MAEPTTPTDFEAAAAVAAALKELPKPRQELVLRWVAESREPCSRIRDPRAADSRLGRRAGVGAGDTLRTSGSAHDSTPDVDGGRGRIAQIRRSTPDRGPSREHPWREQAVGAAAREAPAVCSQNLRAFNSLFGSWSETLDGEPTDSSCLAEDSLKSRPQGENILLL